MADAKPTDAKPAEPTTGITKSTAETGTVAKSPATTTPTYDLKKVLDHVYDTQQVQWNKRDAILYALSIGAHNYDYNLIYEKDANFQVFPVFAATLSFKGMDLDVTDFSSKFGKALNNIPTPNPKLISQASQFIEVLEPLPLTSESVPGKWTVTSQVVGIHENSTGVDIDNELFVVAPSGKQHIRLISTVRHNTMKANGVPFEEVTARAITPPQPVATLGRPKWITTAPTWPEQSCLFRLNGDYNPLHIEPGVGAPVYPVVICHGAGMFGLAARAILEKIAGSDPSALKAVNANFVNPLIPGDALTIHLWDLGPSGPGGARVIVFEARNPQGKVCLGEGVAYITKLAPEIKETNPHATGYTGPAISAPPIKPAGIVHAGTPPKPKQTVNPLFTLVGLVLFGPTALASVVAAILGYFSNVVWTSLTLSLKAFDAVAKWLHSDPAEALGKAYFRVVLIAWSIVNGILGVIIAPFIWLNNTFVLRIVWSLLAVAKAQAAKAVSGPAPRGVQF